MILSSYYKNDEIEKWNKCFQNLDKGDTGFIKITELIKMMKESNLNISRLEQIEEKYGDDSNATISYSDFMTKVINFK